MQRADADLVRRAADGDRAAFASLTETHWAALVGLARSVVGELAAEDAVQDALVIAWGKLASLREATAFPSWLSRIVLHQCLRRRRRWRNWLPLSGATEPVFETDPGAELDLAHCLSRLAPRQSAVLYMTVVEGRSDGEIAELMQISAASVRSHRRRARQRLQHLLNGESHAS